MKPNCSTISSLEIARYGWRLKPRYPLMDSWMEDAQKSPTLDSKEHVQDVATNEISVLDSPTPEFVKRTEA